jgi:hypothetical protein
MPHNHMREATELRNEIKSAKEAADATMPNSGVSANTAAIVAAQEAVTANQALMLEVLLDIRSVAVAQLQEARRNARGSAHRGACRGS